MKKIFIVLLSILCITQSVMVPDKIRAETNQMSVTEYTRKLKKLETYANGYGGDKNQHILNYLKDRDDEFVDYCNEKDQSLSDLQYAEIIRTNAGNVNVYQLVKGVICNSSRNDYKKHVSYPESPEFYAAIDESFISDDDLADNIYSYYRNLTQKKRVQKFLTDFYHIKSSDYKTMKQMITKVNQKYGIKTTDFLVNFFYDNYPGKTMKYFIIGGANYVDIGGSTPLDIEVTPKNAKYSNAKYSSSNTKIATVDQNGIVYGKKKGKFKIRVEIEGQFSEFPMECVNPVTQLVDKTKETEILLGKSVKMKVEISPKNATIQEVTYTTSDSNVATIDQNGKVKAVGPGYVNITAKAYNGTSVVHKFRVYQKIKKIKSEGEKTLIMGKPEKVNYQVFPLGFTDNKIKFSSADPEIATVDKNGMIYPKKNGSTQIIVESKNTADIYSVTNVTVITKMKEIVPDKWQSYYMGYSQKFRYDTDPVTTSNKELVYEMKKNDYASVKSDGTIVPKKIGQTEMTVKSTDGTKLSKKVTIYIEQMVENITVKKNIYLKKGERFHVYYTISPVNATKKAITLKSGDKEKVETNGDSVIAKRYGKTKVTIQSQDPGHKSAEFYVIVKRPLWHYLVVAGIGVLLMVGMVELLKKERKKK